MGANYVFNPAIIENRWVTLELSKRNDAPVEGGNHRFQNPCNTEFTIELTLMHKA